MDQLRSTQDQFNKETAPMSNAAIQDMNLIRDLNIDSSGALLDGQAVAGWEKEALDKYVKPGLWREDRRPPLLVAEFAEAGSSSLEEALPSLTVKNEMGSALMDDDSNTALLEAAGRQLQRLEMRNGAKAPTAELDYQRSVLNRLAQEITGIATEDQSAIEQHAGFRIQRK